MEDCRTLKGPQDTSPRRATYRATRLIMKLHLVHHRFPLCRVHNGETRARSINNGCFAGTLKPRLASKITGIRNAFEIPVTARRDIRRTRTKPPRRVVGRCIIISSAENVSAGKRLEVKEVV